MDDVEMEDVMDAELVEVEIVEEVAVTIVPGFQRQQTLEAFVTKITTTRAPIIVRAEEARAVAKAHVEARNSAEVVLSAKSATRKGPYGKRTAEPADEQRTNKKAKTGSEPSTVKVQKRIEQFPGNGFATDHGPSFPRPCLSS
jgi:hypothetical protein